MIYMRKINITVGGALNRIYVDNIHHFHAFGCKKYHRYKSILVSINSTTFI